jgi:hypothetical protein
LNGASSRHHRQRALYSQQRAFHVNANVFVELRFRYVTERRELSAARIREEDVDLFVGRRHACNDLFDIRFRRIVPANRLCAVPDLIYRGVQRFLTSPGNENGCTFTREAPGGCKANTGAAACNQGNLSGVFCRMNIDVRRGGHLQVSHQGR